MSDTEITHQHFKLYKPDGYLSQFINNSKKRRNKKLLGELYNFPEGTMSIGRLDEMSEGLLLLTTDGKVSAAVTSSKFEKEYVVQVSGIITEDAVREMREGLNIPINGKLYNTKPCNAQKLEKAPRFPDRQKSIRSSRHGETSWLSISIREGKFRQVRKMTAKVGFPTLRLVRVRIGNYYLGNMQPGQVETISISH
jgi:23S rRNA pseudouridine2457 synthase